MAPRTLLLLATMVVLSFVLANNLSPTAEVSPGRVSGADAD